MPKPLDIDRLRQFENPRSAASTIEAAPLERAGAPVERWPSREPGRDRQHSITAPRDVIDRFKRICKDDRRTYADMLGILMDLYEAK